MERSRNLPSHRARDLGLLGRSSSARLALPCKCSYQPAGYGSKGYELVPPFRAVFFLSLSLSLPLITICTVQYSGPSPRTLFRCGHCLFSQASTSLPCISPHSKTGAQVPACSREPAHITISLLHDPSVLAIYLPSPPRPHLSWMENTLAPVSLFHCCFWNLSVCTMALSL